MKKKSKWPTDQQIYMAVVANHPKNERVCMIKHIRTGRYSCRQREIANVTNMANIHTREIKTVLLRRVHQKSAQCTGQLVKLTEKRVR